MNAPMISPNEKKEFINWFLNQYQLKVRESNWILTYLANNTKLLKNVHFVRDANRCPRSIIISSTCSEEIPFRFYRNQLITTNPEQAFHDIRLNHEESLYIELQFSGREKCPQYALILEDNPFFTMDKETIQQDKQVTEEFLAYTLLKHREKELLNEIDQALDERDEARFDLLTKELLKFRNLAD